MPDDAAAASAAPAATPAAEQKAPSKAAAPPLSSATPAGADGIDARLDRTIRDWVVRHINNSPVSRDTAAFNHLTRVLGDLRAAILEEIAR